MNLTHIKDETFQLATFVCVFLGLGTFLFILGVTLFGAWERVSLDFLFSPSVGVEGGVLYQGLGTCLLVACSVGIVVPFSIALALSRTYYLKGTRYENNVTTLLHLANSTPSILFGVVGYLVFVKWFGWNKSWLTGSILLALMILPTVTMSVAERMAAIPKAYLSTAKSLGLRQAKILWTIVLPQSLPGLYSGLLLGMMRAAGETAPIMFTAVVFSGATIPEGIKDSPVLALPYHIFTLAQDLFSPSAMTTVWAATGVLITLVIALSLLSLPFRLQLKQEADA